MNYEKKLIKCTKYVCARCKYRCRFGTAPSGQQHLYNYCCNYLEMTNESRIFDEHGNMRHSAEYCDKFERGKQSRPRFDWVAHTGGSFDGLQVDKPILDRDKGVEAPEGTDLG